MLLSVINLLNDQLEIKHCSEKEPMDLLSTEKSSIKFYRSENICTILNYLTIGHVRYYKKTM
jgi:hypothetical protein